MSTCPNCGAQLTCGCQQRVASDGKKACGNCIVTYEQQLNAKRTLENQNGDVQATLSLNEKFTS
jgi:hypothetical protein